MSVADDSLNNDQMTFAARTREDRSRQAKKQARDRNGRWISRGASVQWRVNGIDYAGTVKNLDEDRTATVTVKGQDSKNTDMTVAQKDLRVTTSKAVLDDKDVPKMAEEDTNKDAIHRDEFAEELELKGTASIKREDGYIIEAQKIVDNDGNPIMYQLYAPGGRSLGIYGEDAVDDFEDMIEEDKATGPDKIIDESGEIVPVAPELPLPGGPVAASGSVIRIARDSSSVIVKDNDVFKLISTETGLVEDEASALAPLMAGGSWRKVLASETELSAHLISEHDIEFTTLSLAQYRVPTAVREAITAAISVLDASELSDYDRNHVNTLAHEELVSLDSIKWINQFFSGHEVTEKLHGGYQGKKWATKILSNQPEDDIEDKSRIIYDNFDDDIFVYFGIGRDTSSGTSVTELLSIDLETDAVYMWGQGKFNVTEMSSEDVEAPVLIVLDAESAKTVAKWIDLADGTPAMDILDIDPEERNLFSLAYPEIDFEEIDRISTIIADATGYSPAERSVNAQRQKRGPGGKFGGEQVPQSSDLTASKKASLPTPLPLVENIAQFIQDWLVVAEDFPSSVTAAGEILSFSYDDLASFAEVTAEDVMPAPSEKAPVESNADEPAATEAEPETQAAQGNILYFAIVDAVDKTAVTDVVAIIKQNGGPAAWLRQGGTWIRSAEKLSDLQGATPPPVVKLEVPEPVKGVLAQIDSYDTEKGVATEQVPLAASGFSLFDGTLSIFNENDLISSVFSVASLPESDYSLKARYHIRKRARALNRMDLIPTEWRELSLSEIGTIENSSSPLYGEFGEIIPALSEFTDYSPKQREHDTEKGYAMPSGAYPIRNVQDLKNAIKAFGRAKESEKAAVKRHIIKRAKALGHPELIPESWGITAAGVPGIADTPSDFRNVARLKNYWAFGKGAAKIRWGTPGDLTRAHRYLAKYVGPMRAWGLAQNLHKMVMGVSNITHDRATGQYKSPGRKR